MASEQEQELVEKLKVQMFMATQHLAGSIKEMEQNELTEMAIYVGLLASGIVMARKMLDRVQDVNHKTFLASQLAARMLTSGESIMSVLTEQEPK